MHYFRVTEWHAYKVDGCTKSNLTVDMWIQEVWSNYHSTPEVNTFHYMDESKYDVTDSELSKVKNPEQYHDIRWCWFESEEGDSKVLCLTGFDEDDCEVAILEIDRELELI